eukprot:gene4821-6865_t
MAAMSSIYSTEVVRSFAIAKVFDQSPAAIINSVDFSDDGKFLITSSNDNHMNYYDVMQAKQLKTVPSNKYGCSLAQFTHSPDCVLHASTLVNDDVRYLSLHDDKYLQYFKGHTDRVTGINLSPIGDGFITTSQDLTMRIWDLRSRNCQGLLSTDHPAVACYDSTGLVFAVGVNKSLIKLYDSRKYEKGPFKTFTLEQSAKASSWSRIQCSPDSYNFALTTADGLSYIINAYSGAEQAALGSADLATPIDLATDFSPCGKYFATGGKDGVVEIWDVSSKTKEAHLPRHHDDITCIRFNPKYITMATASSALCLWLPSS